MDKEKAKKIVNEILWDLDGRGGYDVFNLPDEILADIRETWISIILDISSTKAE